MLFVFPRFFIGVDFLGARTCFRSFFLGGFPGGDGNDVGTDEICIICFYIIYIYIFFFATERHSLGSKRGFLKCSSELVCNHFGPLFCTGLVLVVAGSCFRFRVWSSFLHGSHVPLSVHWFP